MRPRPDDEARAGRGFVGKVSQLKLTGESGDDPQAETKTKAQTRLDKVGGKIYMST